MPDKSNLPEKPTLETLLRFKRHERPGDEFWDDFDRALNRRLTRELVGSTHRHVFGFWQKVGAVCSLAGAVALALFYAGPAAQVENALPLEVPSVHSPSPVLEAAILRETSFAALKESARPAMSAMNAEAQVVDSYTKVWAQTPLFEDAPATRFVAGKTPEYSALPGVGSYVSCAY